MHKSYRGKPIDMSALEKANDKTTTVGNTNTNVAGDVIGRGGKIVETKKQKAVKHYNSKPTSSTAKVSIKDGKPEELVTKVKDKKPKASVTEVEDDDGNITIVEE